MYFATQTNQNVLVDCGARNDVISILMEFHSSDWAHCIVPGSICCVHTQYACSAINQNAVTEQTPIAVDMHSAHTGTATHVTIVHANAKV